MNTHILFLGMVAAAMAEVKVFQGSNEVALEKGRKQADKFLFDKTGPVTVLSSLPEFLKATDGAAHLLRQEVDGRIELICVGEAKCEFTIVQYECGHCSKDFDGDLHVVLPSHGFRRGSCVQYQVGAGSYPTALWTGVVDAKTTLVVELTKPLKHAVLFDYPQNGCVNTPPFPGFCDSQPTCEMAGGVCQIKDVCPPPKPFTGPHGNGIGNGAGAGGRCSRCLA